jgi:hypothetical protein
MAGSSVMAQVHKGMAVTTADGKPLGKVMHVWYGDDPAGSGTRCDEEVCSRLEVHLPHRGGARYIPYNALGNVSGNTVTLSVDESTLNSKLWHQRPSWLPPDESLSDFDRLVRPHP